MEILKVKIFKEFQGLLDFLVLLFKIEVLYQI
jgi:hypothetical protein